MDFHLSTLSDAFRNAQYKADKESYYLYAFILATTADENVFPSLLTHYGELHEITGKYILVVSPALFMNDAPGRRMSAEDMANVLRTKRFLDHYTGENKDVSFDVEDFLSKQTKEAYAFARFCGIPEDKLPCIAFFSSLTNPEAYVLWGVKNQSATSVIIDFRKIVSKIKSKLAKVIELESEELSMRDKLNKLRIEEEINLLQATKRAKREREIEQIESMLTFNTPERLESETKRKKRRMREIEKAKARLEYLLDKKAQENHQEDDFSQEIRKLEADLAAIEDRKRALVIPPLLDVIYSIDRKRFIWRFIKDLGQAVPIFNLGLSFYEKVFKKATG